MNLETTLLVSYFTWISDPVSLIVSTFEEKLHMFSLLPEWQQNALSVSAGILALLFVFLMISLLRRRKSHHGAYEDRPSVPRAAKLKDPLAFALGSVRNGFLAVAFFSFWINLLMLVSPLYMLQVYDRVLTSRSYDTLVYLTALAIGLIAFNAFLELVRSRILVRIGGKLDQNLSASVFSSLFASNGNSRGTVPISDLTQVRNFLSGTGPNAFFDAPWTPIFIALIFVFHPYLGIIALGGAILLFTIAFISELATRKLYAEASGKSRQSVNFADAAVRNTEVVRGMGMIPQLTHRWLERAEESLAYQGLANDRIGLLTALSKFVRPSLQVCMLGTGAYLVLQEATSPGVMIASSIIMGRALAPVEAAVGQWRGFVSARAAYGRLKEALNAARVNTQQVSLPAPAGNIDVETLTLVPPGAEKPVLNDVTFGLRAGEVLAIIGPSAAGKSTLARAMVGVWQPTSGHIRLDGADLSQWIPEELGSYIGYLPQDVELFDGTVADNISRFTGLDSQKVVEAAKLSGAHEMILQFPDGYNTQIGPQGSVLSGGQRQRLGLARALYNNPAVVVLDEPNASLDSHGEKALMHTIVEMRQRGQTVVVVSHRTNILTVVDKVLILNGGRVEAFDRREEILPKLVGQAQPLRSIAKNREEAARKQAEQQASDEQKQGTDNATA